MMVIISRSSKSDGVISASVMDIGLGSMTGHGQSQSLDIGLQRSHPCSREDVASCKCGIVCIV